MISQVPRNQFIPGREMRLATGMLVAHRSIPAESQPLKLPQDGVSRARHFARWVDIFDSEQPFATLGAGLQETAERRDHRAKMEAATRGGRKPPAISHREQRFAQDSTSSAQKMAMKQQGGARHPRRQGQTVQQGQHTQDNGCQAKAEGACPVLAQAAQGLREGVAVA